MAALKLGEKKLSDRRNFRLENRLSPLPSGLQCQRRPPQPPIPPPLPPLTAPRRPRRVSKYHWELGGDQELICKVLRKVDPGQQITRAMDEVAVPRGGRLQGA